MSLNLSFNMDLLYYVFHRYNFYSIYISFSQYNPNLPQSTLIVFRAAEGQFGAGGNLKGVQLEIPPGI